MAQTPCKFVHDGARIDYTPVAAVEAGAVVQLGSVPTIAPVAIAAGTLGALAVQGVFDVPKTSDEFSAGDTVYWNASGNPVSGTAGSGAADSATGNLMGTAVAAAAAGDAYVRTRLHALNRVATSVDDDPIVTSGITGGDSSLAITGLAGSGGSAGGAVPIAGGAGHTNGAGGAASVTGGAGAGTGAGGAASLTGGASGNGATGNGGAAVVAGGAAASTAGTGGAASITGGAGTTTGAGGAASVVAGAGGNDAVGGAAAVTGGAAGGGNRAGGAATVTGGAGAGSAAGGAASLIGGAGGATGAGGAIAVTGGAGGATSGTGGAVSVAGGAGTNGNANGGAVSITGGAKHGSGANGAVNIAADKACTVTIGYDSGVLKLVGIPTSDPSVAGQVWANSNVLTLSAG